MDILTACSILEVENIGNVTIETVKKQYHKLALLNHPDKNGNSQDATVNFQRIQEAYEVIKRELAFIEPEPEPEGGVEKQPQTDLKPNETSEYLYILKLFINEIIQGKYNDIIYKIISHIIAGGKEIALKIIEDLDRDTTLFVYDFFTKHKRILGFDNSIMDRLYQLMREKCNTYQVFLLNPKIQDLFNNNIYKLVIDDKTYLVPLWHDELYFDNDIIVKCIPDLDENVEISENNDIHIIVRIPFTFSLIEQKTLTITVGDRQLDIPLHKLRLQKVQNYTFEKEGISRINDKNMYDIDKKSDIIVTILFFSL
jgi:DnaJ domain